MCLANDHLKKVLKIIFLNRINCFTYDNVISLVKYFTVLVFETLLSALITCITFSIFNTDNNAETEKSKLIVK